MTAFTPETAEEIEVRLTNLLLSLGLEKRDTIRVQKLGDELLLEGWVASYDEKCRIERAARSAGFQIQNCLRVIPAAFHPDCNPTV